MTVQTLLAEFDLLEPSAMTTAEKLTLLNELEGRLHRDVYGRPTGEFIPITEAEGERQLCCGEPEGFGLYLSFLCMRTALVQGESDRYARWGALFGELYASVGAAVSRRRAAAKTDWRF